MLEFSLSQNPGLLYYDIGSLIRSRKEENMSKAIPGNHKHMTQDNRVIIEKRLDAAVSLRKIAEEVGKDPSTVSKEIKKHRILHPHNSFNEPRNKCDLFGLCMKKRLCGERSPLCSNSCRNCHLCNRVCPDFTPKTYHCGLLDKAPFVCNGCSKKCHCRLDKYYYKATTAFREYKTILVESRTGLNISETDLKILDEQVSPLIRQGQSPYTILRNHPEIGLSEKTIYNYIAQGALSVKNIDLPKKVAYKVRNVHKTEIDNPLVLEGRTFKDFQAYMKEHPDTPVVEMDTVIGCEGSHKVLLTLHFNCCSFMAAFLLESKEAKRVEAVFDRLEQELSTLEFCLSFPLILTDRGGEFAHPDALECGADNLIRTNIYYCDPMCSWQKPHCEKNHEYIRKICPKGTSFDLYSQQDITRMMSHINSSPRGSLGGMTPFALAKMMLSKSLMNALGIQEVAPDKVCLTPDLMKK